MFEHDTDERRNAESGTFKERDVDIREELSLETKGSALHPRLFEFSLASILGLNQGRRLSSTDDEKRNGRIQGLSFTGTFLKEHPYSATLFSDIRSDQVKRDFGDDVYNDVVRYGARGRFYNEVVPISFEVERGTLTTRSGSERIRQATDKISFRASHTAGLSESALDYSFTQVDEKRDNQIDRAYDTTELTLTNRLQLMEAATLGDSNMTLLGRVRLFDQTGDSPFRNLDYEERLDWDLSEDLRNTSSYLFTIRESMQERADRHTFRTSLTHQLYSSLRSSLKLSGYNESVTGKEDNADGRESAYRAELDFHYTKKVPGGRMSADAGGSYDLSNEQFSQTTRSVLREPLTLTDGELALLAQPSVDLATVEVRSAGGTLFVVDVDYTLHTFGLRTEIRRRGAVIPNGSDLLIDYSHSADPSLKYASVSQRYGLRLDLFDFVAPYVRLQRRGQNVLSGIDTGRLETLDSRTYGVDFYYKQFTLTQEFVDHDSSLSPYQTMSTQARFFQPFGPDTRLSAFLSNQVTTFSGTDLAAGSSRTSLFAISTTLETRLSEHSVLELTGGHRRTKSTNQLDRLLDLTGEYKWQFKAMEISTGFTFERFREKTEDEDRNYFFFKLTRRF